MKNQKAIVFCKCWNVVILGTIRVPVRIIFQFSLYIVATHFPVVFLRLIWVMALKFLSHTVLWNALKEQLSTLQSLLHSRVPFFRIQISLQIANLLTDSFTPTLLKSVQSKVMLTAPEMLRLLVHHLPQEIWRKHGDYCLSHPSISLSLWRPQEWNCFYPHKPLLHVCN
jgi:hypothetical protein